MSERKTRWKDLKHTDGIICVICRAWVPIPASHVSRAYRRTCGKSSCIRQNREEFKASPERLFFEVWSRPTTKIAVEYGVSDKAIDKRCVREKVPKPPRGYWAKIQSGIAHRDALIQLGWNDTDIQSLGERKFAPDRINIK